LVKLIKKYPKWGKSCLKKKSSQKESITGLQEYDIIYNKKVIGTFKKRFLKKEIIADEKKFPFPRLFNRNISGLNLEFPFSCWIWRREVKSYCYATDPNIIMLSIAMTIYVWLTWNRGD